jgi:plastocyanin
MRASLKVVVIVGALALAGCGGASNGGGGGSGNEVDFGPASFSQTSVTIAAGQAVHFVDSQSSGGTHNLCIGSNGQCDSSGTGPAALHGPGMMITPGQTEDVTFPTAGSFTVTCTIHPSMLLTVTVQ